MFSCKICRKKYSDIDSLMDHTIEHMRDPSSKTITYSYRVQEKKIDSNDFELDIHRYNGKHIKNRNATIIAADKQSNETSSKGGASQLNNSVCDVVAGLDTASIKLEPLETNIGYLHGNTPVTLKFQEEEPSLRASFTEKNNPITSNTECKDMYVNNGLIKHKTNRCHTNKRKNMEKNSQSSQSRIIHDGNEDTMRMLNEEETDTLLAIKQEELSSTLEEALKFYSSDDIIIGTEALNKSKQLEANNDRLVMTHGTSQFSNDNDTKASAKASCRKAPINFDSDDEFHGNMLANIKSKQKQLLYPCDLCDEQFAHISAMRIHRLKHLGKMPYSCDICGNEYLNKSSLKVHIITHNEIEKYPCEICPKKFTTKINLRNHFNIHIASKDFGCEVCGKEFAFHCQLKKHMVVHTGEKRYSCIECDESYRNYSSLSYHRDSVHRQIRPKCDICNKVYSNKDSLFKHKRHSHSNFSGYTCKFCNIVFKHPGSLQRHIGIHSGYALKCSICEKGFSYKYQLGRHELSHTEIKPFQCDNCKRTFRKKESMANHIVNRVCDKNRIRKRKGKKTSKTHTKGRWRQKIFQCDTCNNKFTTKKYLEVHISKCEKKKGQKPNVKAMGKKRKKKSQKVTRKFS